ncbi:MAG: AsmA family protein [Methylococcales bacterium]|nr:AsmA family protein [Methylococcales bacterium]
MKKSLKIILYVFTALGTITLITALCLPFIVNPNDFKAQIESAVKAQTGRTLTINGDLKLSIFPWIGISTEQISLGNAAGFNTPYFAQIQQSEINVKLIPLFSKQLDVSEITIKGLRLALSKNKQGVNNWDDFKSQPQSDTTTVNPLALLAVAGLSIEDAEITWQDLQANQQSEIKNLQIKLGRLAFDQKVPLKASLNVSNQQPLFSQIIDFSGDLMINSALDTFQLKSAKLNVETTSSALPTGSLTVHLFTDALFNKAENTLHLPELKIISGAFKFHADVEGHFKEPSKIALTASVETLNLIDFLHKVNLEIPKMADENALTSLAFDFKLHADKQQLKVDALRLKVDETTLKGSVVVTNFNKPTVQFDLNVDRVNIDRYLPPNTNHKLDKIATPASIAAIGVSLIPVELLKKLDASGKIVIEQLKVNDLKMQGVSLNLDAEKGIVQSNQTIKSFYQGDYKGGFNLNVNALETVFILNEQFSHVQIAALLNDINGEETLKGWIDMDAQLTGRGNTKEAIKSSLKGQISFLLKDGAINGFNIQKFINQSKAVLKGSIPIENTTEDEQRLFSKISATAYISEGLIQNNDLIGISPKIKLSGRGYANLMTEKLDYQIKLLRIKQQATADSPEVISSQPIVMKVAGNFSKPSYKLDIASMLLEKNSGKIIETLERLDKKLPKKLERFFKHLL